MTVAIAAMTVAVRRHKQTRWSRRPRCQFFGSLVSIPLRTVADVTGHDLVVLAMFGLFRSGWASRSVLGSRLLPRGQASLIATLEMPLMPSAWLAFHELPTQRALIGGSLVMGAIVADIISDN